MTKYRIVWETELEADSPREAAEQAAESLRSEEPASTVYSVFEPGQDEVIMVDVAQPGEN